MTDNLNTYNSTSVVNWYAGLKEMTVVELRIFETHRDFLKQAALLDIGIGGGRTTRYLKDKCKTYTGIDYSEGFVTQVKCSRTWYNAKVVINANEKCPN